MKPTVYSEDETKERFNKILRGAMHKPTLHKDIPRKEKRKPAKASSSSADRASEKT